MTDELRHFLLVCEHGTFTEAARRAPLSQPALSASIRRLEEALGARLLDRLPRGAVPSAAGRALIPHARAALGAMEQGRRAVAEVEGLSAGELRIGGGATACTYLLPPLLLAYRRRWPGVRVQVRETYTPLVREGVRSGDFDVGIAQGGTGDFWMEDDLVLVGAPGCAPDAPMVTFTQGAAMRELVDQHFPQADVIMELGSIAAVKGHVRAGLGRSLLSRHAVRDDLALGTLVELPDPRTPLRRDLVLVHAGEERLSPAAVAFRTLLLGA